MKDIRLTQEQKILIAVFGAVLLLLCISGYILINNRARQQTAILRQTLTVPTAVNSPFISEEVYLPLIASEIATETVVPGPLVEVQATETPTEIPSNLWRITRIYPLSYHLRGYVYDIGVFESVSTGENIQAFCADPDWPAPNLGDTFMRNPWNVLVPTNNDNPPWIQHFIVIGN